MCLKSTIKAPERCQWRRSGVFIVNKPFSSVSIVDFEHVNFSWEDKTSD